MVKTALGSTHICVDGKDDVGSLRASSTSLGPEVLQECKREGGDRENRCTGRDNPSVLIERLCEHQGQPNLGL